MNITALSLEMQGRSANATTSSQAYLILVVYDLVLVFCSYNIEIQVKQGKWLEPNNFDFFIDILSLISLITLQVLCVGKVTCFSVASKN